MKLIPRKHLSIFIITAIFLAGCTESGSPLGYTNRPEAPAGNLSPNVEQELAQEAGLKRIIYHVGPVDLPAGTTAEAMLEKPLSMRFQTDEPLWITGFMPSLVNANGEELPKDLLHHAIISNMHENNPFCSDAGGGNPFFIATSMLTKIDLPQGTGYPILPDDPIEAKIVLSNPTETSFVDVYFELELVARPMNEFTNLADVKPMLLELDPCEHKSLEVGPGKLLESNATYKIPDDGKLVVAHGAIQKFGSTVQLTHNLDVSPFWQAEAELDENHELIDLVNNPFSDVDGIDLKKDNTITLGVVYDNVSDKWVNSATAAAMIYMAREN
jgi:hypothetical protein